MMAPKNRLEKRLKYQIISNNVLFTSIKMFSEHRKRSLEIVEKNKLQFKLF